MKFTILTLFPEAVKPYLESSMLWKAQKDNKIKIEIINPREFTRDKHRRADDRPYGGGPGMVLKAEPILRAIAKLKTKSAKPELKIVITNPRGRQFTNEMAAKWAKKYKEIVVIAGHYEGIDARVKKILKAEEISVGPYTLTGGELPAMIMIDAITRRIPGVLGKSESLEESRVASGEVYTRPESFKFRGKTYKVPKILLSGHHRNIESWRLTKMNKK
ncbi:MAG TPA: tRNA (guanosine(37)-N1)-methyltransferase TrmD [Candidatus Paceibacterota bacterium]